MSSVPPLSRAGWAAPRKWPGLLRFSLPDDSTFVSGHGLLADAGYVIA